MNPNIGIDLGSRNARMAVKGRALVLDQSSALALRAGKVLSQGDEALDLWGRAACGIDVVFPLCGGMIAREDALASWLKFLIKQATGSGMVRAPRLLLARAPGMAPGQARRFVATAMDAGAGGCAMMRADLLAALGAGQSICAPRARLVADVGAGQMSATLIAQNQVLACETLPFGMQCADDAIGRMLRCQYDLVVGPRTAENVKVSLATAAQSALPITEVAMGLDAKSGFPHSAQVKTCDVADCIRPLLSQLSQLIRAVLDQAQVDLLTDLMEDGLTLTGGGAQIFGLDALISEATGLTCHVADAPALCVARGLDAVLNDPDAYEGLMEAQQTLLEKRLPGLGR
ncbi:MAG: rod shape-determining protein [Clostridia bacterium]